MNKIYLDFAEFSKDIRFLFKDNDFKSVSALFKNNDYKYNVEYENKIPILKISNKENELYFKFNEFKTINIINQYIDLIDRIIKDQKDYRFVCDLKDNDIGIPINICECFVRIIPSYEIYSLKEGFNMIDFLQYQTYCEVIKECECHPYTFGNLYEAHMIPSIENKLTCSLYMNPNEIIKYLYTAESKYKIIETGEVRKPEWQEYYLDNNKIKNMDYEWSYINSKEYKIIKIEEK